MYLQKSRGEETCRPSKARKRKLKLNLGKHFGLADTDTEKMTKLFSGNLTSRLRSIELLFSLTVNTGTEKTGRRKNSASNRTGNFGGPKLKVILNGTGS